MLEGIFKLFAYDLIVFTVFNYSCIYKKHLCLIMFGKNLVWSDRMSIKCNCNLYLPKDFLLLGLETRFRLNFHLQKDHRASTVDPSGKAVQIPLLSMLSS